MPRCFVALGGNVGPVEENFRDAVVMLNASPDIEVVSVSSVFRFPAVGEKAGSEFRNAAAEVDTNLSPIDLLDVLQSIEGRFGRSRGVHWGPRPLDLDLVFYGSEILETSRLRVPHPACWYRRFVLDPLAEIAPDFVHPEKGISVDELWLRLLARPLPVAIAGASRSDRDRLIERLEKAFPDVLFRHWKETGDSDERVLIVATAESESSPSAPALLIWLGPGPSSGDAASATLAFRAIPKSPRLDVSAVADQAEFVRDVIRSALGA